MRSARRGRRRLRRCALAAALVACASARDPSLHDVTIHYESRRVDELAAEGLRVEWQTVSGNLRVGNVVGVREHAAVGAQTEQGGERDVEQGELRVVEGEAARIATGVGEPAAARMLTPYGMREEAAGESVYDVTPHVLGDGRVRLDFAPFDERRGPPAVGCPAGAPAGPAASVTVAPGAKAALGGFARDSTARGSGFAGIGERRPREERVLVVWIEVEAPGGE